MSTCGHEDAGRRCVLPAEDPTHPDHSDGRDCWADPAEVERQRARREHGTGLRLARNAAVATRPATRSR